MKCVFQFSSIENVFYNKINYKKHLVPFRFTKLVGLDNAYLSW